MDKFFIKVFKYRPILSAVLNVNQVKFNATFILLTNIFNLMENFLDKFLLIPSTVFEKYKKGANLSKFESVVVGLLVSFYCVSTIFESVNVGLINFYKISNTSV